MIRNKHAVDNKHAVGDKHKAWKNTAAAATCALLTTLASAEEIRVGIGHQSMCTDTYPAGIILKELKLVEKYLPHDGKYKDTQYTFQWSDYTSGPPITNMMLADKLDFGVMGDYPLIVNGAKFQQTQSLRSLYVAGTGYNLLGTGNSIVVPQASPIYSLSDLRGKDLSVPVGSAAWGMTLKAMRDENLSDAIQIKDQSPPVGAANIAQNKIAAHADFCPWSELMEFRGTGRKIFDGSEAGVPYLHGIVVRKDYAEKYPEIVVAVIKAMIDADNWVHANPQLAAEQLEKWTGIEKEVQYLYFSRGGHLTLDPTIKKSWVEALTYDHSVLQKERDVPPLDMSAWIDDRFVRRAYKEMGMDYDKAVAVVNDPKVTNKSLPPGEMWPANGNVEPFDSVASLLKAVVKSDQSGKKINATYVYDHNTMLKLFGKVAFYVEGKDGSYTAFMRKPDADAFAKTGGGKVMTYAQAVDAVTVAVTAAPKTLALQ